MSRTEYSEEGVTHCKGKEAILESARQSFKMLGVDRVSGIPTELTYVGG